MIPATCHFVWLGKKFPWLNALAVLSAATAGRFERVVVHADDRLEGASHLEALRRLPTFELRLVELDRLARAAGESVPGVRELFDNMTSAAARSDVLRALILAAEGGVYLDFDTVTIAPFEALRALSAFVGQERICFPEWSTRSHSGREIARAYGLSALRASLRLMPRGYQLFSGVEHLYGLAVNNAVLGAEPGHPWIRAYLRAMLELTPSVARRRYAIGPDLLARVCRERTDAKVELLPPRYFYPLGPVMSECWWSRSRSPDLTTVVGVETVAIHWYASVRGRKLTDRVNADYVRRHSDRQLFSKLASRYLDHFEPT
jgi:hypothetical protein